LRIIASKELPVGEPEGLNTQAHSEQPNPRKRILATLTATNALDRVEGRYAGPNTKLGISVIAVWHITDHYGQLVEYLRLNGIVPPMTQKYGLKVR
jgi:hypothetical protein